MKVVDSALEAAGANTNPLKSVVVGVLAHNEEPTIEACMRAILRNQDERAQVCSVVVVASGCTDRTEEIARRIASEDPRVRLIVEPKRSGKVAAINVLLDATSEPLVVIVGGDMVFTPGSLLKLVEPFNDPSVGMTGVRPIPTNPRAGIVGYAVNILWDIHHELSLQSPKLGEAVAFRRVISGFERGTVFDEATMEHLILSKGMRLRYIPEASVRNRGPETLSDYLNHRTRNIREHLALASVTGHRVSTLNTVACLRAAWRLWRRGEMARYIALAIGLEALASARARLSLLRGGPEDNVIWHPITSSKRVLASGHVLRAHHDGLQKLQLRPKVSSSPNGRVPASEIRRLVRIDDRVRPDRGQLTITFRSDENGATALLSRLRAALPDLLHIPTEVTSGSSVASDSEDGRAADG